MGHKLCIFRGKFGLPDVELCRRDVIQSRIHLRPDFVFEDVYICGVVIDLNSEQAIIWVVTKNQTVEDEWHSIRRYRKVRKVLVVVRRQEGKELAEADAHRI